MSNVVNNKTHHQTFGKSFIIEKKGKRREQCFVMANLKQLGLLLFFFFFGYLHYSSNY